MRRIHKPSDFRVVVGEAIARCDKVRARLAAQSSSVCISSHSRTLLELDSISNEICSVIDVAELVRNVHSDEVFRSEAENAFASMSSYICNVNQDSVLYSCLMQIAGDAKAWAGLDEEQRLLVKDLKREFEAEGIHLSAEAKRVVRGLQEEVGGLETQYMQNTASADNMPFTIGPFEDASDASRIRAWVQRFVPQPQPQGQGQHESSQQQQQQHLHVVCSSNKRIVGALLPSVDSNAIRQQLWRGAAEQPSANAAVLGGLVRGRQLLATALGYPSWAHKALANSVAGSPEAVWGYLKQTAEATEVQASKELAVLSDLKRKYGGEHRNEPLAPWDVSYLCEMHRGLSSSDGGNALAELSHFLPLDSCLSGLWDVTRSLFGLSVTSLPLDPSEAWCGTGGADAGGALKLSVQTEDGRPVGTVYLDLFHRHNKFSGAAHFTIRCGCAHPDPYSDVAVGETEKQQQQLPVLALVFNFSPSSGAGPVCLSLNNLETLFHEWGHALSSLLSKTTFQHLSGTRGALDFVEVPSHLFEHFARSPELLLRWGRHASSGRQPSLSLVREALAARNSFAAIDAQTQLLYSFADQAVFGTRMGDVRKLDDLSVYAGVQGLVAQVQRDCTVLPLLPSSPSSYTSTPQQHQQQRQVSATYLLSHGHFIAYGGAYHSYLLSKMYAAHLWHRLFERDPLNRQAGETLHRDMLAHGAATDTRAMLSRLVGGELDPRHYTQSLKP